MSRTQNTYTFEGFSSPNFTQVPDEFFDELAPNLGEAELRVLLYMMRRTFGFKKTSDDISLSQLVNGISRADGTVLDHGAGVAKSAAARALHGLVEKGIIEAKRNQSPERGFEATTYTLRFRREAPPSSSKRTRGSPPKEQALVLQEDIQETVLQETAEQETGESTLHPFPEVRDISLSKFRKGSRQKISGREPAREPKAQPQHQKPSHDPDLPLPQAEPIEIAPSAQGFTTPGALLAGRFRPSHSTATTATPAELLSEAPPPIEQGSSEDDRIVIGAYVKDYVYKLHDRAKLKSTISRAYNLYREAQPIDRQRFIETLYLAYRKTVEQTNVRGSKMAYFFAILERELGLKDPIEGPMPETSVSTAVPLASVPAWRTLKGSSASSRRKNYVPVIARPESRPEFAPE